MATYNLGRILPIFRGAWSPSKSYDKLDVVTFEGSSYMAISDNTNKRPDENPSAWILSAAKGDPGEPGKDGPTYKPGVGISIVNDVISATGGGEGGGFYFGGFGVEIDKDTNSINAEVRAENDVPTRWQHVTMTGLPLDVAEDFESKNVFHYKGKTYYSAGLNKNYVLDVLSWEKVEWIGVEIYGEDIFVDAKGDMYYFHGNQYMKYDEDMETWPTVSINITNAYGRYMFVGKNGYSYYSENRNKTYKIKAGNITTWEKVTVNQDCPATFIWEDETSTYYSNGDTHFFYDYENDRWWTQRWAGVNALYGNQIWKQGSHIFFSADSGATYVKKGSKWEFVYTLSVLSGEYVFADGEDVFSFVDNRAMQLVIPEPFYVTRHGDRLATEQYVTTNGVVQNAVGYETYKFVEIGNSILPGANGSLYIIDSKLYYTKDGKTYRFNEDNTFTLIQTTSDTLKVPFVNFNPDGKITTANSGNQVYEWIDEKWITTGDTDTLYRNKAYYNDVCGVCVNQNSYYWRLNGASSGRTMSKATNVMPWQDYDGNVWFGEYMLINETGYLDEDHPHPNMNVMNNQGDYVWTDINGMIRLDAPGIHKVLIGSGTNAVWVDFNYYSDIIPEKPVSMYVFCIDNKLYMSQVDKYKTNKSDYLATETYVNAKIGDIEKLLKAI